MYFQPRLFVSTIRQASFFSFFFCTTLSPTLFSSPTLPTHKGIFIGTRTISLLLFYYYSVVFQDRYGVEPTMVVLGVKIIYVPYMPGHSKRLSKP